LKTCSRTQPDGEDEPEVQVAKKRNVSTTPLLAEINEFRDIRVPMRNPTGFWKLSRLARLKVCAKIIISIVSSAGIERLYCEAGMVAYSQSSESTESGWKVWEFLSVRRS